MGLLLALIMGVTLYSFYNYFYKVQDLFVKSGVLIVLIFTTLVIMRYMLLLFFSMVKTIFKSADTIKEFGSKRKKFKRVTITVPAYNEEVVIEKALRSLLEQSYPNLEIIVIDDGSSDRTFLKAKRLEFSMGNRSLRVLRKKTAARPMLSTTV
jgi:cellulose synthase/poly-beta-1,6-N-acetylglucosamine synthase-like glycosyltransferase